MISVAPISYNAQRLAGWRRKEPSIDAERSVIAQRSLRLCRKGFCYRPIAVFKSVKIFKTSKRLHVHVIAVSNELRTKFLVRIRRPM